MLAKIPHSAKSEAEYAFRNLSVTWKRETGHLSNMNKKLRHAAYAQIVSMGTIVVPLMIDDLKRSQGDWFWALTELTGVQPIPDRDFGNVPKMTEAWIRWAEKNLD